MTLRGVEVGLPAATNAAAIELSVSRNDRYDLILLREGRAVYTDRINQAMSGNGSLVTHRVIIPPDVQFDAVLVRPSGGDARYSLGHLRLVGPR